MSAPDVGFEDGSCESGLSVGSNPGVGGTGVADGLSVGFADGITGVTAFEEEEPLPPLILLPSPDL